MKKQLMPYVAQIISSAALRNSKRSLIEVTRKIIKKRPEVHVFLRISDPYSYALVQVLPELSERFDIHFKFYICLSFDEQMYPYLAQWHQHADSDVRALVELYQLNYPARYIKQTDERTETFTRSLLSVERSIDALGDITTIFDRYWQTNEGDGQVPLTSDDRAHLDENKLARTKLGHYLDAMLYYGGEWYWGLDRLSHLEQRLNDLKLYSNSKQLVYTKQYELLCGTKECNEKSDKGTVLPSIELFFSARSPYSYIALERLVTLSAYYGLTLEIKLVLPMVMRGLSVPKAKKMYIFLDTKREADKLSIPYGKVADPVGLGVENCYALFSYAKSQHKELDYLLAFGRAVNAEGVHAASLTGMKYIVDSAGLNWNEAREILLHSQNCSRNNGRKDWSDLVDGNLQELLAIGLWGVPSIRFGDFSTWGQDRIWLLEKEIINKYANIESA